MAGGWPAHRSEVLGAAIILSATAGFLIVRLFAERSRMGTSGVSLAAGTLLFSLLLIVCVVMGDGHDAGTTAEMLAIAAGFAAMITASATWGGRFPSRWLELTPNLDRYRPGARRARSHALRDLNERIRRNPRDTAALAERGKVLLARGEHLRALSDLDKALQLDRKNAHRFLYLKHLVRLSQGDFAQALQDILSAIESDAERREDYYAAAALVYIKLGRIDGIIAMLEKQGLPAPRAYAVQIAALNAALSDIDRQIASETSLMSERYSSGDRSRLDSLDQTRTDILAKLTGPREAP